MGSGRVVLHTEVRKLAQTLSCKRIRHDVFHDLNWDTLSYMRGREGEQAMRQ